MKNWKTTLFGLLLAAGTFMANFTSGTVQKIGQVIMVIGGAGTGLAAKDNNVTGGTKQQ